LAGLGISISCQYDTKELLLLFFPSTTRHSGRDLLFLHVATHHDLFLELDPSRLNESAAFPTHAHMFDTDHGHFLFLVNYSS
jgi:hypothetical protein